MSHLRKELRRASYEANRRAATIADLERLDRHARKLPTDWPSFVRAINKAKKAGKKLSDAQIDVLLSEVIKVSWTKAQPILWSIRQSREFRRWKLQLGAHPGPESKLRPEILLLGMILAIELNGHVHRTIVCQIVNGMDSRIWHSVGMCSRTTRTPVSLNIIERQIQRVEHFPQIARTPLHLP